MLLAALAVTASFSQSVGIGTVTPDPTAILDLSATGKGILVPRMDSVARNAIAGPARGLLVYDSSCRAFFVNRGTADNPDWKQVLSMADGWGTRGNAGTDTAINFIGPIDNMPLHLSANGKRVAKFNTANATYFIGKGAGQRNATGNNNIAIGDSALAVNLSANHNVAIGFYSMKDATGSGNIGIGYRTLQKISGQNNIGIGYGSLQFAQQGYNNIGVGQNALSNINGGNDNTGIGINSLYSNVTGKYNSALGHYSLFSNDNTDNNTAIGYYALVNAQVPGGNNTAVGAAAAWQLQGGSDNTALGYYASPYTNLFSINRYNATVIGAYALADCNNCMVLGSVAGVNGGSSSVNVGIGYNSPAFPLDVRSPGNNVTLANFKNGSGYGQIIVSNGTGRVDLGVDDNGGYAGTNLPGDFRIRTGATNRMFFRQSDGFVGIGTDAPAEKLEINGNLRLSGTIVNDNPQSFALINNWVNYGAGFGNATYYKDKQNIVRLAGLVKNGTTGVIATLPPACRPAAEQIFTVVSGASFARLDIRANGDVELIGSYSNAFVSLDGIAFRVN